MSATSNASTSRIESMKSAISCMYLSAISTEPFRCLFPMISPLRRLVLLWRGITDRSCWALHQSGQKAHVLQATWNVFPIYEGPSTPASLLRPNTCPLAPPVTDVCVPNGDDLFLVEEISGQVWQGAGLVEPVPSQRGRLHPDQVTWLVQFACEHRTIKVIKNTTMSGKIKHVTLEAHCASMCASTTTSCLLYLLDLLLLVVIIPCLTNPLRRRQHHIPNWCQAVPRSSLCVGMRWVFCKEKRWWEERFSKEVCQILYSLSGLVKLSERCAKQV